MTKTITSLVAYVVLTVSLIFALNLYFAEKANSNRLSGNIETINSKPKKFITRDGHHATKTDALVLTTADLNRSFPKVTTSLKNLYIMPLHAESFTELRASLNFKVAAATRDTLTQIPVLPGKVSVTVPAQTFSYADKWKTVTGLVFTDTTFIQVSAVDSIFTAVHRGDRRRPWAWILSRRKLQVAATNRNPDIKITVIQAGIIKK